MDNLENIQNDRYELVYRFIKGELSYQEELELREWMNEKPENLILFEELRNLLLHSTIHANTGLFDHSKALEVVQRSIKNKSGNQSSKTIHIGFWTKIAAAMVIVFMAGFFLSRTFNTHESGKTCEIRTPLGSKTYLILPDGSQVWLNAGSTLSYEKNFDDRERKVHLKGEAFFKVKSNKEKPFIVATSQMNVKALGTSFNVKAYDDDKIISTTLVEGVIKVDGTEGDRHFSYTLKPHQNITIHKNINTSEGEKILSQQDYKSPNEKVVLPQVEIRKDIKVELHTSWKDEKWEIEGEPLNSLAVLLERRFNTRIIIENKNLNHYKFTGNIKNETLEQVIQILSLTAPIRYKIGKGEVWWDIDPRLEAQYQKILNRKP